MNTTTVKVVCVGPEEVLSNDLRASVQIGVDRGALTLVNAGLALDLAIGDFDSVTVDELTLIEKRAKKVIKLDQKKDITDTEAALAYVLEHLGKEVAVTLITAVSGRFDHKLANLSLMFNYFKKGMERICLKDSHNKIEIYGPKRYMCDYVGYQYVSFFALAGVVKNLTLKKLKFSLEKYDLALHDTLCVSNEPTDKSFIQFNFDSGYLAVIYGND